MACPSCGNRERFRIAFTGSADVSDEGSDDVGDHTWEDDSSCMCFSCDHGGTVKDFTIEGLDEFLKSLEVKES